MQRHTLLLVLLLFASLILRLINLNFPNQFYFDENYTAFTAIALAQTNAPEIWKPSEAPIDSPRGYDWIHPPLARTTIAAAITILGNKPWVWRLPSLISSLLSVLLTYELGKRFFSKTTGGIAAYLLAFDGLSFAQGRIATPDSLLVFLSLASLFFASRHKTPLSALAFGLALATKWVAIVILPLILLLTLPGRNRDKIPTHKSLLLLLLVPPLVYLITELPFFIVGFTLGDFVNLQRAMFSHAYSITHAHPFSSHWWLWPLGLKPIPYFVQAEKQLWAIPNPPVFWLGLAAVPLTFWKAKRKQAKASLLILTGYFMFLLPWIVIYLITWQNRPTYLYYYLPSLPFLAILTANWLTELLGKKGKPARTFAIATLAVIPLTFFSIYPRLVGL